jgi:RND family efflux transporter MFP subunit
LSRLAVGLLVLVGVAAGGWYAFGRGKTKLRAAPAQVEAPSPSQAVTVEVTRPTIGGIQRVVVQPGTVEPFESADLYAKVSGYLVEQSVDIGSKVNAGDILARISVPEYDKQVERDKARLKAAKAKVAQMTAHKTAAEAESRAAAASVLLAKVMVRSKTAFREYREKRLKRVKTLVAKDAVDEELRDEQEDYFQSAIEAENAAKEQVNATQEKAAAAVAKIAQAQADLDAAEAEVDVAEADLAKSKVLLEYTVIRAPYTGVVTKRTFHPGKDGRPGAFIKAEDQGGAVPLLTVERTDVMRIIVQVPDRDVPYVSTNATAAVEIDALPGFKFETNGAQKLRVARWARAEDPVTRTMRTEIDIPNPTGVLEHGMYGRVSLTLTPGTTGALRIASSALVGKAEDGRGSVRVVRAGKVHIIPVRYSTDNGVEAEIVAGLTTADEIIIRADAPVEEGTPVTVNNASH